MSRTRAPHHRYERHRGAASAPLPHRYRPRRPHATAYYGVIAEHLETMLDAARARSPHGFGLSRHVEASFRRTLDCGVVERGFARVVCPSCQYEVLVPFSCKSRGLCPSCDGSNAVAAWWRRRSEQAAAEALAQAKSGLEARIAERTQSLIDANAELERSHKAMAQVLSELQASNDRLRIEMAERARLESERRLTSKLEGIGQLAAGIAHEINTPTQYILSNAEMLDAVMRELIPEVAAIVETTARHAPSEAMRARATKLSSELPGLGSELDDAIGSVVHGANSIARIVGAMREFARADTPEMRPADLNRALQTTLEVVRSEYRQVANIDLDLGDLPTVSCHVGEIQQVLANLIVNAAHAIERRTHKTTGKIRIESRHDADRERVVISVSDNGVGIAPEHRERVFDPFFTTKPVGRGTGQGLTIARNVVTRHQGELDFHSDIGIGTRFEISLPVHSQPAEKV